MPSSEGCCVRSTLHTLLAERGMGWCHYAAFALCHFVCMLYRTVCCSQFSKDYKRCPGWRVALAAHVRVKGRSQVELMAAMARPARSEAEDARRGDVEAGGGSLRTSVPEMSRGQTL
eukprot:1462634-Rhodomonas_salina.1